ncbi:rCG26652, partial [Rattus norvegicus]
MIGKVINKRRNVCTVPIRHSKSRDSFLTWMEGNNRGKTKANERGMWVELRLQPAAAREAQLVRTKGKIGSCKSPFPVTSWL